MQNRKKKTQMYRTVLDSVGKGEGGMFRENGIETSIHSRVKQSPARVGCMIQVLRDGALGRPSGMGWRGRQEGVRDGEHM